MRMRIYLGISAGLFALVWTSLVAAEQLTISVTGINKQEGTLMLQVMASEAEFNGESEAVVAVMQRVVDDNVQFTTRLPAGEYAVRVMHDVNGNGELDANFVGVPTEPYGFSNNAKGNFGPPKWKAVKFALTQDTQQTITLSK